MLKLKPDVLDRNHLDGYQVYPSDGGRGYQQADISEEDGDGNMHSHIISTTTEQIKKTHHVISHFSSYEVEENEPEEVPSHTEGIIHTLAEDHPVSVREVVVGDVAEDSEVPYEFNPPMSEPLSEAEEGQYTNPPSIATSTKSTEQLVLPEENGSVFFGQGIPSHSKENVVVERIEYEMPVIKQEIIEPEVEPEQDYPHPIQEEELEEYKFNTETPPAVDVYQQFNVISIAKPTTDGQKEVSSKKTEPKKPRKRKVTTVPAGPGATGMQHHHKSKLPPLPPIQIPNLPHNFTPPIDMLPQIYVPQTKLTKIMMKHPTISSMLFCPPGHILANPLSFKSAIPLPIPYKHNEPAAKGIDSKWSTNINRRKSKPKQRRPVISVKRETSPPRAPSPGAVSDTSGPYNHSGGQPQEKYREQVQEKTQHSPHNEKSVKKTIGCEDLSVKAKLAKKIKMEQSLSRTEPETYPPITSQIHQPVHDAHLNTVKRSNNPSLTPEKQPKQEFGNLRNLLSSAPLASPGIREVAQRSSTPATNAGYVIGQAPTTSSPLTPASLAQMKIDQTLADSYMKNWRQTGRFQCKYCPYSSVTKNYLFRHWLVNHNQECAYQCAYCDFRATYKDSITRHQSINHREAERHILVDAVMETSIMALFETLFGLDLGRSGVRKHLPPSADGGEEEHGYSSEDLNFSHEHIEESHHESQSNSHISPAVRLTATHITTQSEQATSTGQQYLSAPSTITLTQQYPSQYSPCTSQKIDCQTASSTSPPVSSVTSGVLRDSVRDLVIRVSNNGQVQTIKQETLQTEHSSECKVEQSLSQVVSQGVGDSGAHIPVVSTSSLQGQMPMNPALRNILDTCRYDCDSKAVDLSKPTMQASSMPIEHLQPEQNPSSSSEISGITT